MIDPAILRANEQLKAFSNGFFNLGFALSGAVAVKLFDKPILDTAVIVWAFAAGLLIWTGSELLGLLESDEAW